MHASCGWLGVSVSVFDVVIYGHIVVLCIIEPYATARHAIVLDVSNH